MSGIGYNQYNKTGIKKKENNIKGDSSVELDYGIFESITIR